MKLRLAAIGSALLLAFAAAPGPASAGSMTWDFFTLGGSPPPAGKSLGSTTHTYTQGAFSLLAESVTSHGCGSSTFCAARDPLYTKNGGTKNEQGLGLLFDTYGEHEITNPHGILLDLSHAGGFATNINLGSVQSGETWAVWGFKAGTWSELGSGTGNGSAVDFHSGVLDSYHQLVVTDPFKMNQTGGSDSNNIVLKSITTSVPEPGALALFAAGLLGCALLVGRRRRQH